MDEDVLRLALSHGASLQPGLLVYLDDLGDLEGGDEIRRNRAAFKAQQAKVAANDEVMEELMARWRASVPDVDRGAG